MILENPKICYGVVEDITNDPLKLGRCRVRLFNYHDEKKQISGHKGYPTEDLPWAVPMIPTTEGQISFIGTGPTHLKNGTEVICLVRDDLFQDIIILGVFPGVHQEPANPEIGFEDPEGFYPIPDRLQEPDVHRLSRSEKLDLTYLDPKTRRIIKDIPIACDGGTWTEPLPVEYFKAEYPFNQTHERESGHVFEIDDTPGFERIHTWHSSGAYDETINTGERIIKVPSNFYITTEEGEVLIYSGKGVAITCKDDISFKTEGAFVVEAKNGIKNITEGDIEIKSKGSISLDGATVSTNNGS